jgi:hypothetical protein
LSLSDATRIKQSSARLNGIVNANGGEDSKAYFCYSTSNVMTNCAGASFVKVEDDIKGTRGSVVSRTATGLLPLTTYYFSLKTVQGATTSYSSELRSFTTIGGASVSAPKASNISDHQVTLSGTISANGSATTVEFCFSTRNRENLCRGESVKHVMAAQSPLAATASGAVVSAEISTSLTESTKYYYQIRTRNSGGTMSSSVGSFTTLAKPFSCNASWYEISATSPKLYKYSPQSNTFSSIGSNARSGFNALAFNYANRYMYAVNDQSLYVIDSKGVFTSLGSVSGIQSGGASFVGETNYELTNNGSGTWAMVDVAALTPTAMAMRVSTESGNSSWGASDFTVIQKGDGTFRAVRPR